MGNLSAGVPASNTTLEVFINRFEEINKSYQNLSDRTYSVSEKVDQIARQEEKGEVGAGRPMQSNQGLLYRIESALNYYEDLVNSHRRSIERLEILL